MPPGSTGGFVLVCPTGTRPLGGGCNNTNSSFTVFSSGPTLDVTQTPAGWTCSWSNTTPNTIAAGAVTISAYAFCATVQ